MKDTTTYAGINSGMKNIAKIIRDAKVFDVIGDDETCEGWNLGGIEALLCKVDNKWDKYACLVNKLPKELFDRHQKIRNKAINIAKASGLNSEEETRNET